MNNAQSSRTSNAIHEFKLPDLGEGMHEAEIVEWLIQPGDTLKLDQTMVKVETDKAIVEIPSPVAGRVSEIRVSNGQVAKVGDVLITFETPSATNTTSPASSQSNGSATITPSTAPVELASAQQPAVSRQRILAAPAVRKLAFELGVDLAQVPASASNGRVTIDDVRAYAERGKAESTQPASSAPPVELQQARLPAQLAQPAQAPEQKEPQPAAVEKRQPLTGLRKRIAEHMEHAWRTIPHATAFDEVDGGGLKTLRQSLLPAAEKRGIRLTYIPLLIKLLLPVLKEFPIFNASMDEERREIIYKRVYHIGIATASPEGLLVPVLRNADHLTLLEVASNLERLIEGARTRTLSLPELSGSTFTLNNVGSFGGSSGTPIINSPEVAILAVGKLQDKAIVRDGAVVVRPMMPLTLSFDHRLIDGAMAGAFLARFKELVENPQQLMLDMI
ncbi:MAG TPA: dihydrolipoamide acetyltransferase family protein [Ktedonobacteraceae bacterium]|nr:dihydrolipoamide acetyltransferase family protein [Ktedonobacteraceae bacterium]